MVCSLTFHPDCVYELKVEELFERLISKSLVVQETTGSTESKISDELGSEWLGKEHTEANWRMLTFFSCSVI